MNSQWIDCENKTAVNLKTSAIRIIAAFAVAALFIMSDAKGSVSISVSDYSLVVDGGGLAAYKAFPDICRLQDGRLMTVFYDGYTHISTPNSTYPNGGRISYVTSSDEGETWSPISVLYDTPDDDRDPSITQLPNGDLLCTFFQLNSGVYLVRSSDGGGTWSAPQLLTDSYYTSSPVRRMSDGTLVLGMYYEPGDGTAHGAVITSNDNGYTWNPPVDIPNPSGAYLDAETDVIELNGGDIWAVQRSSHSPAQYSVSSDGGATWSDSQTLDFVAHCPYLLRTEHNGMIFMGYRGYYSLDGWGPGFTGLRYSLDECQTWSDPIVVDNVIGAYNSMVNLSDGSVLMTYYEEGGVSNIRSRRLVIYDVDIPDVANYDNLGRELIREDFEASPPGTLLNTQPGWSGPDDFVISETTIDRGQSLDCSAGSTPWPRISQNISYVPSAGESYVFSGTLWIGNEFHDYAHAQLRTDDGARLWIGLGYNDLVFQYDFADGTFGQTIRVPIVENEDASIATMDFKVVVIGDGFDAFWRLNGDDEWIYAGRCLNGIDIEDFTQLDFYGHGGYSGMIDSIRLAVLHPQHPGDANLDGQVDGEDAAVLAANWMASAATWYMGDFNKDGSINDQDAAILAANWGYAAAQSTASVPEPGFWVLLSAGMLAFILLRIARSVAFRRVRLDAPPAV